MNKILAFSYAKLRQYNIIFDHVIFAWKVKTIDQFCVIPKDNTNLEITGKSSWYSNVLLFFCVNLTLKYISIDGA